MRYKLLLPAIVLMAAGASALNVVWDNRTPEECRTWGEKSYIREQMEVLAPKICKALYGDSERSRSHENVTIILYLSPSKGGNPAFAAGRRITWKVGAHPGGDGTGGMGLLCHEMTHVLDMGSDRVFTEAMADWVRNYKVNYHRCSNPPYALDLRYRALRGGRHYGKYVKGAHFIDFMTQNYGEGTIYKILKGYREYGKNPWQKLFDKDFDGLLAEWRQMETIYDPVYQWTYNGTVSGVLRHDNAFCNLGPLIAEDTADKSGVWLRGITDGRVNKITDGNMTLALHGRLPKKSNVAIASLGTAKEGSGKAVLLATTPKKDVLAAHVIASLPGRGKVCTTVSTMAIPLSDLASKSHSVILTTSGGDTAMVILDGRPVAKIDMKSKCADCTFAPVFALGGMAGGISGIYGITESSGADGVCLDDVRVFTRTFRARESKNYAATFNANYRGAVAVTASWCGEPGSADIGEMVNWFCVNSLGERVFVLPTKETEVTVSGRALPSIPPGAKFVCKSFTIGGWAVAEEANIDLRGAGLVNIEDNARIITRGHGIAVNTLSADRVRLDGSLAVVEEMKIKGNLEMKEGSFLRLPADPEKAFVKSISVVGEGTVVLKPGGALKRDRYQKFLCMEELPKDLTHFRLSANHDAKAATFHHGIGGKFLAVTPRR
ncbi:MAG: hypothetical protein J5985_00830 [Kiritimatiellae bacterium]|nr:hypothetical protein [Kiritimatiellia bacterium]